MSTIDLTVTRDIPATPAEIYDVWLDQTSPGGPWFGVRRAIVDPRVDGLFYHSVAHEGHDYAHYGRFVRLERPRLIEHTWVSEATRGLESVVTVTLETKGADTRFTLRHTGVPDDAMGRQHQEGWTWMAAALFEAMTARRARAPG